MIDIQKTKSNKYRRFYLSLFIVCFMISFSAIVVNAESNNLLENEGFEDDNLKGWEEVQWNTDSETTYIIYDYSDFNSGTASIKLSNIEENDYRLRQSVNVDDQQIYRFSAFVKTENIKVGTYGGAISIWETFAGTGSIITNGEWQYHEFYGVTNKGQKEVVMTLGLGGYGSTTTGDVWFDDVSMEAVESVPSGALVQNLGTFDETQEVEDKAVGSRPQYIYYYTFLYLLLLFGVYYLYKANKLMTEDLRSASFFVGIVSIITITKIFIAPFTQGFDNDIALFSNWGYRAASDFTGLYESEGFLDYPPLYMYILAIIGKLNMWFNIQYQSYFYELLLKMPSIVADGLTAWMMFKFSEKLKIQHIGFVAGIIYILNPLVLLDATIWGQVDSLFVLIIVTGLYFIWNDRMVLACISFALAVLLKPQGIIFLPVLFFELVHRKSIKLFVECVIKSVLVGILVIIPFVLKSGPLFIVKLYIGTVGGYTYATFNAFNFFGLLGANYTPDSETLFVLSYATWGLLGIIAVTSFVMWLFYKRYTKLTPILGSLILCSGVFIFSARMHERYMFPVIALLLISYLVNKNNKYLLIFVGFTMTNLINVQLVLYHHYFIDDMFINPDSTLIKLVAGVNIGLFIWLVKITLKDKEISHVNAISKSTTIKKKNRVKPAKLYNMSYSDQTKNNKLTKKDILIMTFMSAIYLALTLYQLGNYESPESHWSIPDVGESFVVEFDEDQELGHISYYAGVASGYDNSGAMEVEVLDINNEFVSIGSLEEDSTFIWKVLPLNLITRQVRFTSTKSGGNIHELGFYSPSGQKLDNFIVPLRSSNIGEINYLFDEQGLVEIYPDRMNSTYFDEVYFARTAYEFDQDLYIYETTHPTFGKLMILLGIKIFGNNPFGWRIIGALMGVLLIPIMFVFGKRLFKNSFLAFCSAFLMMFDFMHFTHSRFASIDVFSVVCVLLMYYFMYRYFVMDTYKTSKIKSISLLVLSGFFMALGISTKWNVVYGVLGLAIVFFASRYFVYYYYDQKGMFASKAASLKHPFIKREFIDVFMLCVPIFVVLPLVIYGILHIPIIPNGSTSGIKSIIDYQVSMYDYHSSNSATHPFSSKWYEWPLMIKPLWLYAYSYAREGMKSTIASFGNPAIWWPGIVAFFVSGAIVIKEKDRKFAVVFVAYLLQILPWVFVERTTYIYHYFTAIPFNIFMIVYVINYILKRNKKNKYFIYLYLFIVFVLFVVFYPALSGMGVSTEYIEKLLLLKSWYF